uniref:Secreted protein n=1 Tax=Parascaris univalens TaxID=6257 RepID=A0A915BDD5_PARUN
RFLLFTFTVLLLSAVTVDAKKNKGEQVKNEAKTYIKKENDAKPLKVGKEQSEAEIVAATEDVKPEQCERMLRHDAPTRQSQSPHILKLKNVGALTEYEKCKLDCKKKRDQADLQQYVKQLKAELVQAEAALAEEQKLHEQQQRIANSGHHELRKEPIEETETTKSGDE